MSVQLTTNKGSRRQNALFILVFVTCWLGACTDESFVVTQCEPGQGYDLDETDIPRYGEANAPIAVTLFGDFQCPPTERMSLSLLSYADSLAGRGVSDQLKILFRHLPSPYHTRARAAAEAATAAHLQGNDAFWALFPFLFQKSDDLEDDDILLYASRAGLDVKRFTVDLKDPGIQSHVDGDIALAGEVGIAGTPGVLICGLRHPGDAEEVVDNLEYLVDRVSSARR